MPRPDIDYDAAEHQWTAEFFDGSIVRCPTLAGMKRFLDAVEARQVAAEQRTKERRIFKCLLTRLTGLPRS